MNLTYNSIWSFNERTRPKKITNQKRKSPTSTSFVWWHISRQWILIFSFKVSFKALFVVLESERDEDFRAKLSAFGGHSCGGGRGGAWGGGAIFNPFLTASSNLTCKFIINGGHHVYHEHDSSYKAWLSTKKKQATRKSEPQLLSGPNVSHGSKYG